MRRFLGMAVLLALVASPTVARSSLFCRFTRIEITDCEEQRAPEHPVVPSESCCERRILIALDAPRPRGTDHVVVPAAPVVASVVPFTDGPPRRSTEPRRSTAIAVGPPLFLVQRALLI